MRHWKKFRKNEDGASAVEFALIFPMIVAFVFGVFEVGRVLYAQTSVNAAASFAGRQLYLDYETTENKLKEVLKSRLSSYERTHTEIDIVEKTASGTTYKVMTLFYTHELAIPIGETRNIVLKAVRYTPVIEY